MGGRGGEVRPSLEEERGAGGVRGWVDREDRKGGLV